MKAINRITIIGRLGADPEEKQTKTGVKMARFPVATNRRIRVDENQTENKTDWHRVICWGKTAEISLEYLKKGQPIYVEGRLNKNVHKTEDGKSHSTYEIHATEISFLGTQEAKEDRNFDAAL